MNHMKQMIGVMGVAVVLAVAGCHIGQPAATAAETSQAAEEKQGPQPSEKYSRSGFAAYEKDGRLWVFKTDSKDYEEFKEKGWPAKNVRRIGAGPDGMTLIGPDFETLDGYQAASS